MTHYKKHIIPILAAFACSFTSAAHAEPFSAEIVSKEVLISQATNKLCPARGMLTASGDSAPLGKIEVMATDCVTASENKQTLQFNNGRMVMTASDGSGSVIANYEGVFHVVGSVAPDKFIYQMYDGAFTIIGGTGRYKKATGSGTLNGEELVSLNPAVPAEGKLKAEGTISY